MKRAQVAVRRALADGVATSVRACEAYLREVRRYFDGFEREARVHLADLDRRLAHASQLQFNLTAERGVAQKRVEATRAVLERARECVRP